MNLVTGSTGILGANLIWELVLQNKPVIAAKQASSNLSNIKELFRLNNNAEHENYFNKITWIDLNLFDVHEIEEVLTKHKITTVYHCAGIVSFSDKDKDKLFKVNEYATANLVDACLNFPNVHLCHVSSISTLNNSDYQSTLDESVFWKTSGHESFYAISKYNGERQVWRGIEEGLKAVIINPGVVLSLGFSKHGSNRIIEYGEKGSSYYPPGSSAYVAASDVAQCMIKLIESNISGQRYIISENNYPHKEIIHAVQQNLNKRLANKEVTYTHLYLFYLASKFLNFFRFREVGFSKASIYSLLSRQNYSNAKIIKETGHTFKHVKDLIFEICTPISTKRVKK